MRPGKTDIEGCRHERSGQTVLSVGSSIREGFQSRSYYGPDAQPTSSKH